MDELHVRRKMLNVSYSALTSSAQVWQLYIESQQAILSATQFVMEMNQYVKDPQQHSLPFERMRGLHKHIDELITFANEVPLAHTQQPVDSEATAARALRCMSIVKLNRCVLFEEMRMIVVHTDQSPLAAPASNYTDTAPSQTYQFSLNATATSNRRPQTSI